MLHDRIRNLPGVRNVLDRTTFETGATVDLRDWDELDAATAWAAFQSRGGRHRYRRHVAADERTAVFEFEDHLNAVEFKLRFG